MVNDRPPKLGDRVGARLQLAHGPGHHAIIPVFDVEAGAVRHLEVVAAVGRNHHRADPEVRQARADDVGVDNIKARAKVSSRRTKRRAQGGIESKRRHHLCQTSSCLVEYCNVPVGARENHATLQRCHHMKRSRLRSITADPFRKVLDAKTEESPNLLCDLNRQTASFGAEHTA
jgi:hypothetical protein